MNNLTHVCVCICVYTHWYSIHSLSTWQRDGLHWPRQTTTADWNLNPFNAITMSISYPGSWFKENTSNHYRITTEYPCSNYNFHTVKMVQGWGKKILEQEWCTNFLNERFNEWVSRWVNECSVDQRDLSGWVYRSDSPYSAVEKDM